MGPIEQSYPFITNQYGEAMQRVHARADAAGILELHPVGDKEAPANDAAVLLFRGELSVEECKSASEKMALLGANKYSPATLRVEGNSVYTIYSVKGTPVYGFVKVMNLDLCA